ncbi:hypothetical protein Poly41_63130 [Novipirellula artificiosorum]|uniref:Uncharacterized protein n=1 Tax=Novipirellula artificiosorum TaxID=2528016 RepID=A0A5C6D2G0_9BACT|nr:hypothetical protein Poly41_63130 [Novipirellula artificiosorum]
MARCEHIPYEHDITGNGQRFNDASGIKQHHRMTRSKEALANRTFVRIVFAGRRFRLRFVGC